MVHLFCVATYIKLTNFQGKQLFSLSYSIIYEDYVSYNIEAKKKKQKDFNSRSQMYLLYTLFSDTSYTLC